MPGIQGTIDAYRRTNPQVTLREIAGSYLSGEENGQMIGSPDQVADHMQGLLEEGGGHGFQITPSYYAPDFYADLVEKLIPALQKRGLFRRDYADGTLRHRLSGIPG